MVVEATTQKEPVIKAPEKRVRGVRRTLVVTAAAASFAVTGLLGCDAIQPKQQTPDQTPLPGGIVEPSLTPTPFSTEYPTVTLPATPEASKTPEVFTFPATLNAFVEGKITASPKFNMESSSGGLARLNITETNIQYSGDSTGVFFQGVVLGEEVVDNHLIGYVGFADTMGNQFFIPINLGRLNNKDKDLLEYPRSAIHDTKAKEQKTLLFTKQMEKELAKLNGQNIALSMSVYYVKGADQPTDEASRDEIRKQNAVTKSLFEWSIATTQRAYTKVPMTPLLEKLINQRIIKFDPYSIPSVGQVIPYKNP